MVCHKTSRTSCFKPLGDQLNLILTQSKCQMTINFQGSWHCAICQYLLVREFENNEHNETAREHFETVNEKSSSEQFYSRTQCDSTSLPSRLPWQDVKMKTSRCCLSWLTDLGPVTCGSRQRPDRTKVLRTTKPDGLPLDTTDELLQPLGDQLNLILTQSKCQMTINFQGSWHCAIC